MTRVQIKLTAKKIPYAYIGSNKYPFPQLAGLTPRGWFKVSTKPVDWRRPFLHLTRVERSYTPYDQAAYVIIMPPPFDWTGTGGADDWRTTVFLCNEFLRAATGADDPDNLYIYRTTSPKRR